MIRLPRTPLLLLAAAIGCSPATPPRSAASRPSAAASQPAPAAVDSPAARALARGVAFLKGSQNPDGSWGTGTETRGLEVYSMVPGSHDAFRVATTALCVMALRDAGESAAHDKGLQYLIHHGEARRDDGSLLYNTWAHTYALQCLSIELRDPAADPRVRTAAEWHLDRLRRYQTYLGGWNYYDFEAHAQTPSLGPTSFGTAAGLVALLEAKRSGLAIPDKMIPQCVRRLEQCRTPEGGYLYGSDYEYHPLQGANRLRGSVGRTQAGNFALWSANSSKVGDPEVRLGLNMFFREHPWIDMGRKRPVPHESWYQTAGYYFYFGHYYAARLIERLGPDGVNAYGPRLAEILVARQEGDGSWWDFAMWDYHKPYGTAFAVMTLARVRDGVHP